MATHNNLAASYLGRLIPDSAEAAKVAAFSLYRGGSQMKGWATAPRSARERHADA
jgi:hypothetical protein